MNKKITYDFRNDRIKKELDALPQDALLFDTETNGLSLGNENKKDNLEIVELALVDLNGNTVYHSLFKPEKPISSTLSIVNNITNEMLETAPKWKDEWSKINKLMKGKTIIGFNIDNFDVNALDVTCARYDIPFKETCDFNTVDIMPMFIKFTNLFTLTYSKSMFIKQEVARNICGLETKQTHRADDDCRDLLGLINEMKRRLIEKDPIDAETFINKLPKESSKNKYRSYLEKEAKSQKMFNDLVQNKPLKEIIDKYKYLDEKSKLENTIIKMNKNGFVDLQNQLDLDDDLMVEVIEKYEETKDIYKTAKDLGIETIKVKNAIYYQMPKYEAITRKSKAEIVENLTEDELDILNKYVDLKKEISKIEANLNSISNKVMNVIENNKNNDETNVLLANNSICFDYNAISQKDEFDKETFKRENPATYEEYLAIKDNKVEYTKSRESIRFNLKEDVLPDDLKFENVDEFTTFVAENMKNKNKLTKELKESNKAIIDIFTSKNCNRIDLKDGRFSYSKSEPTPKFDSKRFENELPELKELYCKHKIEKSLKLKTARGLKDLNNFNEWYEENLSKVFKNLQKEENQLNVIC